MANLLKEYLQEIGVYSVLTAEEEVELANKIEIGKGAQEELNERGEELTPEQKGVLYDLIADGDYAREELINHNLKLVVSIAKNYHNAHLDLLDLIQEGNMGLMIAVEKFDPSFNCRFSTCATPWIKQAITKSIIDKGKNIRIPAHIFQLLS
ncbi:MAG: sigma-70 family RNA polymerase sigma factor, partial [Bacillota bacterium]|nr:sigma-70 family RNA polymerase sigma factor [Bacillota bacterium]